MSYQRSSEDVKLRVNHRGGNDGRRETSMVAIIDRIPADVLVMAWITQPTAFPQSDQGQRQALLGPHNTDPARFVFEQAARLQPRSVFGTPPGNGRGKILLAGPAATSFGDLTEIQVEPDWAAISNPGAVSGALVPKGRVEETLQLAQDGDALVPDAQVPAGLLLRIRLAGETAETTEDQAALAGTETSLSGRLKWNSGADDALNIAPGSVVFNFSDIGGNAVEVRDRGDGQLVGQAASPNLETVQGTIDYRTGEYTLNFSAVAGAQTPTASYERDTLYRPLDAHLEWDAVLAYG